MKGGQPWIADYWRANRRREIRIGVWVAPEDSTPYMIVKEVVPIAGEEYSDEESAKAKALVESHNASL